MSDIYAHMHMCVYVFVGTCVQCVHTHACVSQCVYACVCVCECVCVCACACECTWICVAISESESYTTERKYHNTTPYNYNYSIYTRAQPKLCISKLSTINKRLAMPS